EPPAGRERNEEHGAPVIKAEPVCLRRDSLSDTVLYCPVYIPPELRDHGIGTAPRIYQRLQFLLGKPHLQRTHGFQCAHRSAVAQGQFRDFSFLTEMSIDAMLLHRNMEHLACRCAVNIAPILKNLEPPSLPGKPGDYPRLDCREVRYNELPAILRHKCRANELGEGIRDIFIKHGKCFIVTAPHQSPRLS